MVTGIRSSDYSLRSQAGAESGERSEKAKGGERPEGAEGGKGGRGGPPAAAPPGSSTSATTSSTASSTDVTTWTEAKLRKAANQGNQDAARELDRRAEARARLAEQQRQHSSVLDSIDASRFQVTAGSASSSTTSGGGSGSQGTG